MGDVEALFVCNSAGHLDLGVGLGLGLLLGADREGLDWRLTRKAVG